MNKNHPPLGLHQKLKRETQRERERERENNNKNKNKNKNWALGGNGEKRPQFQRMNENEFLNEFLTQEIIWVEVQSQGIHRKSEGTDE